MRVFAMTAAIVAACALGACASTTSGTGGGSGAPSTSASSTPVTLPPPSSPLPVSVPAPSTSAAVSSAPLSSSAPAPTPVAAPKACAAGKCTKIRSADLDGGYTATVYSGPSPSGQLAAEYLQLALGGVSVFWKVTDGYSPGQLVCSPTPAPNCAVEDGFGAHASSARGLARIGNALIQFDEATSDTPITDVQDLNGDGWIDVVSVQNTYEPDYATGKVFWMTSLSNGKKFIATGCTPAKKKLAPKPSAPVSGTCKV